MRCKEDKLKAWLYERITVNGKSVELSLQHKIARESWDTKNETVCGSSSEVRECNEQVILTRRALKSVYEALKKTGYIISASAIKAAYLKSKGTRTGKKLEQHMGVLYENMERETQMGFHEKLSYNDLLPGCFCGKGVCR